MVPYQPYKQNIVIFTCKLEYTIRLLPYMGNNI